MGETDISRRLPSEEGGSTGDWTGASGGEYCVPTSTVTFAGAIADDDWVDVDQVRLCGLVATAGERGTGRGNAAAGGVLMVGCGEVELRKRYDPLWPRDCKTARGDDEAMLAWRVGEGVEVIISKSD